MCQLQISRSSTVIFPVPGCLGSLQGPDVPQTITFRCRNAVLEWCPYMKCFSTGAEHDLYQDRFLTGTSGFDWAQQKMAVGGIGITFGCENEGETTFLMPQNLPQLLFQPYHCWSYLSNPCCHLKDCFLIWQACFMTPCRL